MRHPALALLELDSVALGIRTADAMVKRAPISLLKAGTVHPGHYLVMIGGSVASVEESYRAGLETAGSPMLDDVLLPDVHPQVHDAALGARLAIEREALAVLETRTVASLLRAADAAVKGADVRVTEIRLADDLGGRAFVIFNGGIEDVEAAIEIGSTRVEPDRLVACTMMPSLDASVRAALEAGSRFGPSEALEPDGAELPAEILPED